MKTIELDLEKDQKLDTLTHFLKNKKINLGEEEFLLKIHSTQNIAQLLYAGFLLLLAKYFTEEKNKSTIQNKNGIELHNMSSKIYYEFYLKNYDVNRLESKIEKDFNINIELEKKNPLDEVFGIWKNKNITIGKLREKAWQRTK